MFLVEPVMYCVTNPRRGNAGQFTVWVECGMCGESLTSFPSAQFDRVTRASTQQHPILSPPLVLCCAPASATALAHVYIDIYI